MKRIYISDVVHEELKKEAQNQGRTLQWLVEERLVQKPHEPMGGHVYTIPSPDKARPGKEGNEVITIPPPIQQTRTTALVYQEITRYKAELAERLEYCQDYDERTKIEQEGKDTLDALWVEYNELKEQK